MAKKSEEMIRSSAAEYLTYVAAAGEGDETMELRYQDEDDGGVVWGERVCCKPAS